MRKARARAEQPAMESTTEPIAIVGMACRLPGAVTSPASLWQLLRDGSDNHARAGYFLNDDIRAFDHDFFGILAAEAAYMDPQQRLLLEVVYECFESAGVRLDQVSGSDTGCYVGNFTYDYPVMQSKDAEFLHRYSATGMGATILSNRISHTFNMTGPSLVIDTACSSSLYCLHAACTALENGDCGAAVVASANLIQSVEQYLGMEKAGVLSPTGTCRTFSDLADGYARADAVCAMYLKRVSDAVRDKDPIRAVIRGCAVGSNGKTNGISAPDAAAQERVIRQAYRKAGLDPGATSYVECHGTGTPAGDPIEVEALSRVFQRDNKCPLLIGGVKPNIGHGEAASGLSGVIKTVLALEARQIPPTINVERINPRIKTADWGVEIVRELRDWLPPGSSETCSNGVLRAGVNSFGYGGANAHVILESASPWVSSLSSQNELISPQGSDTTPPRNVFLLPFSATNMQSLKARVSELASMDIRALELDSLAYTLSCRRTHFRIRGYITARKNTLLEDLKVESLRTLPSSSTQTSPSSLAFVFTGQGAQWAGMGKELFEEFPTFRQSIRYMDAVLRQLPHAPSWALEEVILDTSPSSPINVASYAQPMTTALQVAIVELLTSWDVHPTVVVGHSSGEIAAAFAAGHITAEEAIVAAYYRGYVNGLNGRDGAMLAVGLGADEVVAEVHKLGLEGQVQAGCHNSPENATMTGDADAIAVLSERLQDRGVFVRKLRTGGKAYHSHHMASLGPKLEELLQAVPYSTSKQKESKHKVEFISTVTAGVKEDGFDAAYWRTNMESPVLFSQAMQYILRQRKVHLVEIGPHSALELPLRQICSALGLTKDQIPYSTAMSRGKDGATCILDLMGRLYLHSQPVSFDKVNSLAESSHVRVIPDLPPYPWQHDKILWKEPRASSELRLRRHPHHELLGSLIPGGDGRNLQWRNKLRLENVPWLEGHKLEKTVIFPAAGYVAMAVEAVTKATEDLICGEKTEVILRNVKIHSALMLAVDEIELFTMLRPRSASSGCGLSSWWEFEILSNQDGASVLHSTGSISVQLQIEEPLNRQNTHCGP